MLGWSFRVWFIIIAATILLGSLVYLGHAIYSAGSNSSQLKQATEQIKETAKVKKAYAKIDHAAPADSKPVSVEWLRNYTSPSN